MPNEYCRSGFHSGETASGYFDESLGIFFNGLDRKNEVRFETLEITERQGAVVNECAMSCRGRLFVTLFQDVGIYNGGYLVGVPLFRGNIVRTDAHADHAAQEPIYDLSCSDQSWLLDYHAVVTKTYRNQGISTIVGDILYTFTEGGFHPGYLPQALGNLEEITFENVRVSEALTRLAKACQGTLRVGYDRRVSIFRTPDDEGNSIALTDASTDFWDFAFTEDGSSIATRVIREGVTTTVSAAAAIGDTTLAVADTGPFLSTSGTARSRTNYLTYTGKTTNSGPGFLTGVTGIAAVIDADDPIAVYRQEDGFAASLVLAGNLVGSGSFSGQSVMFASDGASISECIARAGGDIAQYQNTLKTVTYTTTNPHVHCGATVAVTLTLWTGISESLVVQEVRIKGRHKVSTAAPFVLDRVVTASPVRREFSDALIQAGVV